MEEEDSSAIETTQTRLSDYDGQVATTRVRVFVFLFFVVKLDALISYYERDLFYY